MLSVTVLWPGWLVKHPGCEQHISYFMSGAVLVGLESSRGLCLPGEEDKGGDSIGVRPASLPAVEGKGWGEPKTRSNRTY